jgi:hypothetical protein
MPVGLVDEYSGLMGTMIVLTELGEGLVKVKASDKFFRLAFYVACDGVGKKRCPRDRTHHPPTGP